MEGGSESVAVPSVKARQKRLCQVQLKTRPKAIYEDQNNFGVRMLAKLGWSVGKGLGTREDGIVEPVSVQTKRDVEGLGYAGEKDNQWTQHDADFSSLLKTLNGESEQNSEENTAEVDPLAQLQPLEERSKKSRARVHYKKFTRGKDLSQANEKDLASIFGRRSVAEIGKPVVPTRQNDLSTNASDDDSESEQQKPQVIGLTSIKSKLSMNDYFKEKMKQKQMETDRGWTFHKPNDSEGEQIATELQLVDEVKQNKKCKQSTRILDSCMENVVEGLPKKTKRKHTMSDAVEDETETESSERVKKEKISKHNGIELEQESAKKKKKSKKNNPNQSDTVAAAIQMQSNVEEDKESDNTQATVPVKKVKKSKKNNDPVEHVEEAEATPLEAED